MLLAYLEKYPAGKFRSLDEIMIARFDDKASEWGADLKCRGEVAAAAFKIPLGAAERAPEGRARRVPVLSGAEDSAQ